MDLEPGEQVIFAGHPSWRSLLGFYVTGLLLLVAAGAAAAAATTLTEDKVDVAVVALVAGGVLVLVAAAGYLKRLFTRYTITDQRLHIRRGIIARREQQTLLAKVQNVNTRQSIMQRLLAIGTVNFDTAAGDDYDFQFWGVDRPKDVVAAVHRAQRAAEQPAGQPA